MKENMSRKDKIVQAQFNMIQTTGRISGEVKNILTSEEKSRILESIENVNKELTNLASIIHDLSNALNLDFNKIIGGKNENNI